jgi:serine/threonine-protein phosphatase 2B catalytic subunit
LVELDPPIIVSGDIHGKYIDLLRIFEIGNFPPQSNYLFLGDYVDRGSFSIEVVAYMYALKIIHPKRVRMLRGNHECRQMTSFFNFREECEYKYDVNIYNAIMDSFDTLPLAATVNGKFLCVHGGLSPELPNLKAVNGVNRFQEPPREGLLCDLIWSDPLETPEGQDQKKKKGNPPFIPNEVRGCSYFYSFEGAAKFLQKNSLLSIIRAHEAQLEGYKMHKTNPSTGFPSVITIFSAPNYYCYNNKAAILKFDNSTLNILQFTCSPHPYHLPNFMDVFAWSMPFVIEKVTEMLYYILQPGEGDKHEDNSDVTLPEGVQSSYRNSLSESQNKVVQLVEHLGNKIASGDMKISNGDEEEGARDRMRKKVRSIARMARMFKTLRQENETVIRLKGVCPGHKLSPGLLLAGKDKLTSELEVFQHVKSIDAENEHRADTADGQTEQPGTPIANTLTPRDFDE